MKTTKLILIITGVLLSLISFSQENYLPGFIITTQQDTLSGFIDYRNWSRNPAKIQFKNKLDAAKINYTTQDIHKFGVHNEIYVSAIVETEISSSQVNNLSESPQLNIRTDTTFLQIIIDGSKSLLYYNTSTDKEQFYIKIDTTFHLLIHKKYTKIDRGLKNIIENNKFQGQLIYYLENCPSVGSKAKNAQYNKRSLEKLFLSYYACSQSVPKFHKKVEKVSFTFGILAGISSTKVNFGGDTYSNFLISTNFPTSQNITGGLFFNLILARNQKKWSIYNDLIYRSYKIRGHYETIQNENVYRLIDDNIEFSYLKINNMLRFTHPVKNDLFIFVNTGFSNGFVVKKINSRREKSFFYSTITKRAEPAIKSIRKHEIGYLLGLGAYFKQFSVEMRVERGNGMSNIGRLSSKVTSYYLLLGYKLW